MRLVLYQNLLDIKKPPLLPENTFVFSYFEDFSVGPLGNWNDQTKFSQDRAEFWRKITHLDLPDGSKMDYFVWLQALPQHDLMELVQNGVTLEDFPETYELDARAPKSTAIEIWGDLTVRGSVFRWYVIAALAKIGIDRKLVSFCNIPNTWSKEPEPKFWNDMLLDAPTRRIVPVPASTQDWEFIVKCWEALTNLPGPIDQALKQCANNTTLRAFETVAQRYPSPETGLTNLQARLLNAAQTKWHQMVRIVSDAMIAGYAEDDPVGHEVLQAELEGMSRMTPPLVEIDGSGAMRFCKVRLSPHGETARHGVDS